MRVPNSAAQQELRPPVLGRAELHAVILVA